MVQVGMAGTIKCLQIIEGRLWCGRSDGSVTVFDANTSAAVCLPRTLAACTLTLASALSHLIARATLHAGFAPHLSRGPATHKWSPLSMSQVAHLKLHATSIGAVADVHGTIWVSSGCEVAVLNHTGTVQRR